MQPAKALIQSVKGKSLSKQERGELAIQLAGELLKASEQYLTRKDRARYKRFARMMQDESGKAFMTAMLDSSFRTKNPSRICKQLQNLLRTFGIPSFLNPFERALFFLFQHFGNLFPKLSADVLQRVLRKETKEVILPGEEEALLLHLRKRTGEDFKTNLNRLGEAILGEEEAKKRLELYLEDLQHPEIEVISIKISSIFSQINHLAYENSLHTLKERLRLLYRACLKEKKLINLDMEESQDLALTVDLFQQLLDEPEFHSLSQGIALQSYLPESFLIQKRLTQWAARRLEKNGAPIRIRIVKGANLGMERVEASIRCWQEAPYATKMETDANFKRMLEYGMQHTDCVHLGVASHNLFDIAYALLLRSEYSNENNVAFEMLEGMATHLTHSLQEIAHNLLLYCPAAKKEDFHTSMAYLMRRLDEQTCRENFLPHLFDLEAGSAAWEEQKIEFLSSLLLEPPSSSRRTQIREKIIVPHTPISRTPGFHNEADTDLSFSHNRKWALSILADWQRGKVFDIPCLIAGKSLTTKRRGMGKDPTFCDRLLYSYSLATEQDVEIAVAYAKEIPVLKLYEKQERFHELAALLRENRAVLIGAMMAESGKIFQEADSEVSEAIDMAEYYSRTMPNISGIPNFAPRIALVASPWNFPLAIPTGSILQAIGAGFNVLFKPAPEAVLLGSLLANIFNRVDLPVQFLPTSDEPTGSFLVRHPDVHTVLLTGATNTARHFLKMRPTLPLFAETGGKNSMIVTSLADRDLAIRDIVQSSFSYSGQKCSALSLLICEEEVYYDPQFRNLLRDAAASLPVGSQWDPKTKVGPLIRRPQPALMRALQTCDAGEEWLLQPVQDEKNPLLWSPGIKMGVQPGSFMHQTELFGPVLGVMVAKNLKEAITLANATPYGLTAGLHSLDSKEHTEWKDAIQAGNLYINRGITGAIVGRQPFGGTKASSFGIGMKGGGPHAILQLVEPSYESSAYTTWWEEYFSKSTELVQLIGQENRLFFKPHREIFLFLQENDDPHDVELLVQAAQLSGTQFIAYNPAHIALGGHEELSLQDFLARIQKSKNCRIRCLKKPPEQVASLWVENCSCVDISRPSPHGGFEFLHFVREVSLSYNFHRYGNIATTSGGSR